MARITVEDSLTHAKNRFALVLLTSQRTKQLLKGSRQLTDRTSNREIVTALREIADGNVVFDHPEYLQIVDMDTKSLESTSKSGSEEESTE